MSVACYGQHYVLRHLWKRSEDWHRAQSEQAVGGKSRRLGLHAGKLHRKRCIQGVFKVSEAFVSCRSATTHVLGIVHSPLRKASKNICQVTLICLLLLEQLTLPNNDQSAQPLKL